MNSSFLYHAWGLYTHECTSQEYKGNTIILHIQTKDREKVCPRCGTFLVSNVLDARKATYIGAEIHNLTKWVVDNVAPAGTSIGGYITRVMEQHYADNWERILAIYEAKLANKKTPLENASFIKHKEQ